MTGALGLFLLWILSKSQGEGEPATAAPQTAPAPAPAATTPTAAAAQAAQAAQAAAANPTPSNLQHAAQAAQAAAQVQTAAAKKAKAAAAAPAPWPQQKPTGLPPFPSGWEPDQPPPAAVVTRAWQLLPILWKSGKPGGTSVETIKGRWITFQAQWHDKAKKKKGVTAYRVKPGQATAEPSRDLGTLAALTINPRPGGATSQRA